MEHSVKLKAALRELQQITGLTLDLRVDTPEEEERAIRQLGSLCSAYREKYDKIYFWQSLLTGTLPLHEREKQAKALHISPEGRRVLFLLEVKGSLTTTIREILKNLFPTQRTCLIPLSETTMAILHTLKPAETAKDVAQTAYTIVDTLNMDALTRVWISYSAICRHMKELPDACQDARLALKVGRLFSSGQTIFPYNKLGIGRLIYHLPVSVCRDFLKETLGEDSPSAVEEEMITVMDCFLKNNLNIAETARRLHMHRNTLIYRLDQMQRQTGLDLRRLEDAMTYRVAVMVMNYLHSDSP